MTDHPTPDRAALDALISAVTTGETFTGFWLRALPNEECIDLCFKAYKGSLDAALALFNALLPGLTIRITDHGAEFSDVGRWNVKINWQHMDWQPSFTAAGPFGYSAQSNTPARALLLATLTAYRETRT